MVYFFAFGGKVGIVVLAATRISTFPKTFNGIASKTFGRFPPDDKDVNDTTSAARGLMDLRVFGVVVPFPLMRV